MKRKYVKIAVLLVAAMMVTSCGSSSSKTTTNDSTEDEETEEAISESDLSDDLYSFQVEINGEVYELPFDFSELEDKGWEIDDYSDDNTIEPNQYTIGTTLSNGDMTLGVEIVNFTGDVITYDKGEVCCIEFEDYDAESGTEVVLPKGITFGATKDEVIDAYGEPTDEYDGDTLITLTYELDSYESITISIDAESNTVDGIEVENITESEDDSDTSSNTETSTEVPDDMPEYTAPTELSDDLLSFTLEYADDLYTLPAPVSEFVENGWTIQEKKTDTVAAMSSSTSGLTLMKDNQTLETTVYNPCSEETAIENCYVIKVKASSYSTDVEIKLPGGITLGSTKEEVEAAYGDIDSDIDSDSISTTYEYSLDYNQSVEIYIDNDTNSVESITVTNNNFD